jgi:hypothetical protein
MTTATLPTSRPELLQALRQRARRADEIAEAAERDGNEDLFQRAVHRLFFRQLQVAYIERRPEDARCPDCERPDGVWTQQELLATVRPLWLCLSHAYDLEREAAEQLNLWLGIAAATAERSAR